MHLKTCEIAEQSYWPAGAAPGTLHSIWHVHSRHAITSTMARWQRYILRRVWIHALECGAHTWPLEFKSAWSLQSSCREDGFQRRVHAGPSVSGYLL